MNENSTPESTIQSLKDKVNLRDKMGGAIYWNILNDECCQLANKCIELGCDRTEVSAILGLGTFY